jgi:hypothetical protein
VFLRGPISRLPVYVLGKFRPNSGLRARPAPWTSNPVLVHRLACLLHTSFRPRLATTPLRFTNPSVPSRWVEDFHLQAIGHARHTKTNPPPFRAAGCSTDLAWSGGDSGFEAVSDACRLRSKVSSAHCWAPTGSQTGQPQLPKLVPELGPDTRRPDAALSACVATSARSARRH